MNERHDDSRGGEGAGADDAAAQAAAAAAAAAGNDGDVDIDALIADPAAADKAIPVAKIAKYLEQKTGSIIEKVTNDIEARQERDAQERRTSEAQQAAAKEAMDFAAQVDLDLKSPDEEIRAAALKRKDDEKDKYRSGLALAWQAESKDRAKGIIESHLAPLWSQLKTLGPEYVKLIDADFKDREFLAKNLTPDGQVNWLKAVVDVAESRGYNRGKTEAADEADRNGRVDDAAGGAPSLGGGTGDRESDDLWAGIDRTKPGAYREYQQRLNDRNAKRRGLATARR